MQISLIESLRNVARGAARHELGLKVKQIGERHTVTPISKESLEILSQNKRQTPLQMFETFQKTILPHIQDNIELNLINKMFSNVNNKKVVDNVIEAYKRRKLRMAIATDNVDDLSAGTEIANTVEKPTINVYSPVKIEHQDENDVGLFTNITEDDLTKFYNRTPYGDYIENQYEYTGKASVMCTEEALRLKETMSRIKPVKDLNIDYQKLFKDKHVGNIKMILNDEHTYQKIFQDLSICLNEELKAYRHEPLYERLFSTSNIFDLLIRIVINEIPKNTGIIGCLVDPSDKKNILCQIVSQVFKQVDVKYANSQNEKQFLAELKELKLVLPSSWENHQINLKEYIENPRSMPKRVRQSMVPGFSGHNSGCLLHGTKGTGKSGVLLYSSLWAHKNDWVVVNVPNAFQLTQEKKDITRHHASGLYLQYDDALAFLQNFKRANEHLIGEIKINESLYGLYNISGVHKNDTDPAPNLYYEDRKVYWKEHEKFYLPGELEEMQESDRQMDIKLGDLLEVPKTILDLVNLGLERKELSICCVYEILEQLYNCESHCVLVTVDEYNYFFRPSAFHSFRYAVDKKLQMKIPPYHLSLCRAFMNFDGHKIKSGFKMVASSHKRLYKHDFDPKHIMLGYGYGIEMKGLALNDYRKFLEYLYQNKQWIPTETEFYEHEQLWMESQGNWYETLNTMNKYLREA